MSLMKKYLIGAGMAIAVAAVALGVRGELAGGDAAAEAVDDTRAVAERTDAPAADAGAGAGERADNGNGDGRSGPVRAPAGGDATLAEAVAPPAAEAAASTPGEARNEAGSAGVSPAVPAPAPADASVQGGAEAILRRASAAYEAVRSLRAEFVQTAENLLIRSRTVSRGTLYQRRPDRLLMRFSDPEGDVVVSDGRHIWVYYPSVDAGQVIRIPVDVGTAGVVDLQAQFLGDPVARFDATLEGEDAVDGRVAHVLTLVPREPSGFRRLKVWVDARDALVRRFELTEENGVVRRFELKGLELNPGLEDGLFRFEPPPGARVVDRG